MVDNHVNSRTTCILMIKSKTSHCVPTNCGDSSFKADHMNWQLSEKALILRF